MTAWRQSNSSMIKVLRNRNFLLLWSAQGVSQIAQNMLNYLVIVLVEQLTGSSTQTSLAILSFIVPGVLFASVAGVVVDHSNKRTVLLATTLLRVLATLGYFVYLLHGQWSVGYLVLIIDLVTFLRTCVNQFFWPAENSAVPLLVEREHFFAVNALIGISTNVFNVFGFIILGPFLLKLFGLQVVLWTIAGLYVAAAGVLALTPRKEFAVRENGLSLQLGAKLLPQAVKAWRTMSRELRESWDLILRDRPITIAIVYSSIVQALALMIGTLAPGFVTRVLELSPEDAIVIIFPAGLGMLLGFFGVGPLSKRLGPQRLVNASMVLTGVSMLGLGAVRLLQGLPDLPRLEMLNLGHPVLLAAVLWCFLLGLSNSFIIVPTQTLLQDRTPEEAYGRIFANRLLIANIAAIGPILLTGAMADLVGIPQALAAVGILTLFIALFGLSYLRSPGPAGRTGG
ncbi:MAG: MFS transporter [Chloroflexia bacterium]|nr:MFS transporter [Chloroflexia bacterium]